MAHQSYKWRLLILAAALDVGACVPSEVRKGADLLAVFTHQASEEGASFVRARTELAQARRANIAILEQNAVELETAVSRDLEIWALSGNEGKRRVELMHGIQQFAINAITRTGELSDLRKRHEASIATAKSVVDLRQADLSKAEKLLATLSQDLNLKSELAFFANYVKEVKAGIDDAKKTADQHTKAAENLTKNAVPKNEGIAETVH
jgi:hypothetical protein